MQELTLNIELPDKIFNLVSKKELQAKFEEFIKREYKLQNKTKKALQGLIKDSGILKNVDLSDITDEQLHLQED